MELREKLADLRKKKGLTQAALAEELSVSRQAVSRWEVGAAVPSTENFKCLAELYEVPLEYLLREDGQEPEKREREENQKETASRGMKLLVAWMTALTVGMILLCTVVFVWISSGTDRRENVSRMDELERSRIETEGTFRLDPLKESWICHFGAE